MQNVPLLLTSAVKPDAAFTRLDSPRLRIHYTAEALKWWLKSGQRQIVICDGSNFDLSTIAHECGKIYPNAEIEVLYFRNDSGMVSLRGKGYGEGEITAYALDKSRILNETTVFAKCTSKIWVENFPKTLKSFNGLFLADVIGTIRPKYLDTRFYVASRSYYDQWLRTAYLDVDDSNCRYLEHCFIERIFKSGINKWIAFPSFRTVGISGTAAINQSRSKFKSKARDLRNLYFRYTISK